METLVALRHTDDFRTAIIYPTIAPSPPLTVRLSANQLAIYLLETSRRLRMFAFRTLAQPSAGASLLPGVRPGVDLLLTTRTRLAASRLRNLLIYLRRRNIEPDHLADDFWLSLGVVLNGRIRGKRLVINLLAHEHHA